MKYFLEEETKDVRLAFEEKVLVWPHVESKKMFGCPCYQVKGRLFAFLVTKGLVITRLTQSEREKLSQKYEVSFFQAGKKVVKGWARVSINEVGELENIMEFVRRSYESSQ